MKKDIEKLIEEIEAEGWAVAEMGGNMYELQKYSPAGHDFIIYIEGQTVEELEKEIYNSYENMDPSEEAALWIDHTGHGTNGAPYELIDIYEDMAHSKREIFKLWNRTTGRKKPLDFHEKSHLIKILNKYEQAADMLQELPEIWQEIANSYNGHPLENLGEYLEDREVGRI